MAAATLVPVIAFGTPQDFPKPQGLVTQVEFWKKVFAEYSENQVAVHDNLYLDKIYTVIDLRPLAESGADDNTLRRERHRREKREMDRVDEALGRLARGGYSPDDLGGLEREIWNLFKDVTGAKKFTEARDRVRTQQGLRER
ncbi:MAG TPA: lytic transglycosylase, partial [Candidatus Binatia bacterium]|nr:lytic transglycosylase [Candidatus Binatia bacterium]